MLNFVFPAVIQAGIASGAYEIVRNTVTGQLIGLARDKATGRFVAHAVGAVVRSTPLAPFAGMIDWVMAGMQMVATNTNFQDTNNRIDAGFNETNNRIDAGFNETNSRIGLVHNHLQFLDFMSGAQMVQSHLGFQGTYRRMDAGFQETYSKINLVQSGLQSLQASVGVLSASTAVIGVGVVTGVVLSAVNLHQTMKLRDDIKNLRVEVKDGFIDLKKALKSQGVEIIQRIDEVAQDIKFEQHRLELTKAYGRFVEANKLIQTSVYIQDINARKVELANARQTLGEALAIYNNPRLLSETCAAGKLRRMECAWAIEQAIAIAYQLQNEFPAVSDRLTQLQAKIRHDAEIVIHACETEDELDFIFPELTRIHDHDLAVLESWQNHIDWVSSLAPAEIKLLQSADFSNSESIARLDNNMAIASTEPPEQVLYQILKQKSHPESLRDQLLLTINPELRREYTSYITQQALMAGYKTLVPSNLEKASNLTVANLYYYFQARDESAPEAVEA